MYEAYFGLTAKPFELVPNPRYLFDSRSHKKALNYLRYGLREGAGFILLSGEVGSGKTTIIRNIVRQLSDDMVLASLFNTRASAVEMLAMINEEFGLDVAGRDKVALLRDLNDYLLTLHAQGRRALIIIDEAQNLSPEVLEEIRLLSNLEAETVKLVQIVLVGQPELQAVITRPELRQLRQRIGVHCQLDPLSREETEAYVYHRLATAGNRDALNWQAGTFDMLFHYSGGIPRLINLFCDFSLLCAYADQTRELSLPLLQEVIGDLSWEVRPEVAAAVAEQVVAVRMPDSALLAQLQQQEQLLGQLLERQQEQGRALHEALERIDRRVKVLCALNGRINHDF
ncbi:XrtA/PEP-CTERM system-associated ATPase [Desulfuromonas thiophila]|uniref:XrtA/PEP-CTERM system-associated ATPase n=1 Tax=Desulfuromonas thiophila TaxID=57664 RepID=UPI0024A9FC93|nr:XrtA/PEP-CTERM system-associated ATPase [Desulfuromonas thiophila]